MGKYKNIILISGGVILTFALIGLLGFLLSESKGSQPENTDQSNGFLAAEESSFDFGNISMAAGKVSHTFKIKNSGAEPVIISKIYTSCMCTETTLVKQNGRFGPFGMPGHISIPKINQILKADEEAAVEVVFDPAAHGPAGLGQTERKITIENNGKNEMTLLIRANVMP